MFFSLSFSVSFFVDFGSILGAQNGPKSIQNRSKTIVKIVEQKTKKMIGFWSLRGTLRGWKTFKNHWFLQCFFNIDFLEKLPCKDQKSIQNYIQNRSKIDPKSIKNDAQKHNDFWFVFFIDFGWFLDHFGSLKGAQVGVFFGCFLMFFRDRFRDPQKARFG